MNKAVRETQTLLAGCSKAETPQAPGDATFRKRVFRVNFVIFRRRSKRIACLESVNFSTCLYMQIFNFRDG